jgi:hypothetical protein
MSKEPAEERPPDFLHNDDEKSATRQRAGEPDIYLSWGGQVYGPTGAAEVLAGLRASWFADDATFWWEGQDDWLPVGDFPTVGAIPPPAAPTPTEVPPEAPPSPAFADKPRRRSSSNRKPKPGGRPMLGYRGILIVFAFILLAVSLTVGILLLLMQV